MRAKNSAVIWSEAWMCVSFWLGYWTVIVKIVRQKQLISRAMDVGDIYPHGKYKEHFPSGVHAVNFLFYLFLLLY